MTRSSRDQPKCIGWREWLHLPDLKIDAVKAKIDTGARTSALHAFDFHPFVRDGEDWLRFRVHPVQRNTVVSVLSQAQILDQRHVRSSSGRQELRWVVETTVDLDGVQHPIELTLTRRDSMGFRMLLGREALRGRYVVDPSGSFLLSRHPGGPHRKRPRAKAAELRRRAEMKRKSHALDSEEE